METSDGTLSVGCHERKEFWLSKRSRADKVRGCTLLDNTSETTDMVNMPVCSNDLLDRYGWINLYPMQVREGSGLSCCLIDAGVHNEPKILTKMQDNTFAVAGAEERNFYLVMCWSSIHS